MIAPPSLEATFFAALAKGSPAERAAFLDEVCAGAPDVRHRVERMLAAQARAGEFLESPVAIPGREAPAEPPTDEGPGTVIGPYQLVEPIGEGGFGVVYRAEQSAPVRRQVALKVLKAGMDTKQVVARFEAERQALALMDHPNIAKVFDGGATAGGRPYVVMELVRGVPITEFCDRDRLPPRHRLGLFVQVCQAVQHAHQKGVIHRDLKPSNVLVGTEDGRPAVKVIDFGVAKAVGPRLTEQTVHTDLGAVVGTVEYMSPEQASLDRVDVDTRSDIYSLGVLLFELLTGTTPLARATVERSGLLEALRVVREEDAPTLSHRLAETAELPAVAARRGLAPHQLASLVRGELDWIVTRALEKDRGRRYETAAAFAQDVERYLADEPVQARPPSAGYRARKFLRRNRGPVLAVAALVVLLVAGTGAVVAVQARADRERAAHEARTAANLAAALDDARAQVAAGWEVTDQPDRLERAAEAAAAALRRADDFAAAGAPTGAAQADLDAARAAVDELARHARLIGAGERNRLRYADENNDRDYLQAKASFYRRHVIALLQFGLDPLNRPVEETARAVADSRVRDVLLGMLLEMHERYPYSRGAPGAPYPKDQLGQLVRTARQACGGAYARWQDLLDRKDNTGLAVFAVSADGLGFRSTLVAALGRDLLAANDFTACRTFLRAAVDRYPQDVWLHADLALVCTRVQPPDYPEALRHASAACVQRPKSAGFHVVLARNYRALGAFDQATDACRKALALSPESQAAHLEIGFILRGKKDADGEIAALRQAVRIEPKQAKVQVQLLATLRREGRHAETVQATLAAWRAIPTFVEYPPNRVLYDGAVAAMRCAQGLGVNPPPAAERPAYRKQALEFLTADLDAIRKLPPKDLAFVYDSMLRWQREPDFSSVREPLIDQLPPEEREGWKKLWAGLRALRDLFGKRSDPPKAGK